VQWQLTFLGKSVPGHFLIFSSPSSKPKKHYILMR